MGRRVQGIRLITMVKIPRLTRSTFLSRWRETERGARGVAGSKSNYEIFETHGTWEGKKPISHVPITWRTGATEMIPLSILLLLLAFCGDMNGLFDTFAYNDV
jgi:hypothetical protein